MSNYLFQAVSDDDGEIYTWVATTMDFAGAGFPGPGAPLYVALAGESAGNPNPSTITVNADRVLVLDDWAGKTDLRAIVTAVAMITLPTTGLFVGQTAEIIKSTGTFVLTISGGGNNVQANEAGSFRTSVLTPSNFQTTSYRYRWDGTNWIAVGPIGFKGATVSLSTRAALQSDAQQVLEVAGTVSYTVNNNTLTTGDRVDFIVVSGSLTIVEGSNANIGKNAAKSLVFAAGTVGSLQVRSEYGDTPQEFWLFGDMT